MATYHFTLPWVTFVYDYHEIDYVEKLLREITGNTKIKGAEMGVSGGSYYCVFYDAPNQVDPTWAFTEARRKGAKQKDIDEWGTH